MAKEVSSAKERLSRALDNMIEVGGCHVRADLAPSGAIVCEIQASSYYVGAGSPVAGATREVRRHELIGRIAAKLGVDRCRIEANWHDRNGLPAR